MIERTDADEEIESVVVSCESLRWRGGGHHGCGLLFVDCWWWCWCVRGAGRGTARKGLFDGPLRENRLGELHLLTIFDSFVSYQGPITGLRTTTYVLLVILLE
jgi:hypothetical protein